MTTAKDTRRDVWRLLRRNVSPWQMAGYAAANLVGLTVILVGILFYTDSRNTGEGGDAFFSRDYAILSKRVEGIGFTPVSFSESDINDIKRQPWAGKVGRFTTSQFTIYGSVALGGRGFSTYLFFESVPDEFFDVKPNGWDFDPQKRFVPIVISKDYLTLYNFGFAIPQGLPQLSEDIISAVPVKLRLTGEGRLPMFFDAAIVGFSSRLNTIAVPQGFMDWANRAFSSDSTPPPSRLIVETDRMAIAQMERYLADHDIEMAGDKAGQSNVSSFLGVVSAVVAANGMVISLLALFILLLSIFLLLQKSRDKLRNLMLLGYSPSQVSRYYEAMVLAANAAITALSLAATLALRTAWIGQLREIGLGGSSPAVVFLAAALYLVAVTLINIIVIRRHLKLVWKGN